jgi:hypothetical protein
VGRVSDAPGDRESAERPSPAHRRVGTLAGIDRSAPPSRRWRPTREEELMSRSDIDALNATFMKGMDTGDAALIASVYAPDARTAAARLAGGHRR